MLPLLPLVTGELTAERIANAVEKYMVEEASGDETHQLAILPAKFQAGMTDWDDYIWIVDWKTGGRSRPLFEDNDPTEVDRAIELVLRGSDLSPSEKVQQLCILRGVRVPVASAFLTFIQPDRYTVIDPRAWGTLYSLGELDRPSPSQFSPADYDEYLRVCRRVAAEYSVDLRTLDRALFSLNLDESIK